MTWLSAAAVLLAGTLAACAKNNCRRANQLFELTLENTGGSTVGKPTGPVQFIGRAVKLGQAL